MFIEEKSEQPSTNRRECSVSLYYFRKVFFNFKVSYHLSRCKKSFATDIKGFLLTKFSEKCRAANCFSFS